MGTLSGAVGLLKRAAAGLWAALWQYVFRVVTAALAFICLLLIIVSLQDQLQALVLLLVLLPAVLAMLAMERRNAHTGSSLGISGVQANTSSAQPDSSTTADADLHSAGSVGDTADVQPLLSEGAAVDATDESYDDSSSTAFGEAPVGTAPASAAMAGGGGAAAAAESTQQPEHQQHASTPCDSSSAQPHSSTNADADLHTAGSAVDTADVQLLLPEGVAVDAADDTSSTASSEASVGTAPARAASVGISSTRSGSSSTHPTNSTNTDAASLVQDLHSASWEGNTAEVLRLLSQGVPVDAVDDSGRTALHRAVAGGHAVAAVVLLDHKADVNVRDINCYTPLTAAVFNKDLDLVRLLISKGADPNASNTFWRSVLAYAVGTGSVDIVGLLLQAGAKGRLEPGGDMTDALAAACYVSTHSPAILKLLLQHDTPATKEGLASLLRGQLRNNRYETAAQLVRHRAQ